MKEEFDGKGLDERPDLWNRHKLQSSFSKLS